MRDIGRRLNLVEKRLRPGKEIKVGPPIITLQCGRRPTAQDEQTLGPVKNWITYKQQLQAQEKANAEYLKKHPGCLGQTIVISLDVDEEYRRRSERKCPTLTED